MSADAKVLDRIAKLLRLATNNPSEEEARTAALQAAKLIVEHKFAVGREVKPRPPAAPYPPPDPYPDLSELLRRQAEAQQAQARQAQTATFDEWMRAEQRRAASGVAPDGGSWWQKRWRP